ncbi:MAG: ZIP family metal transporter [Candidatus Pacebacteria bacterium]|nr:ZIP family metal transporter [Candidatus Paceibacterota bacterium]
MNEFIYAIVAVLAVSAISLVGLFTISLKKKFLDKIILILVAFAAGSLLGAAFFEILPEAIAHGEKNIFAYVFLGLMIFFMMERYIYWHHCHKDNCKKHYHPMTYLNLAGDAIHNFVDGALIAASFAVSVPLGITATFAITAHEIPQEIGDFAILIHGGFSRAKALLFNFISALFAVLGVIAAFFFINSIENLIPFILAIAGGGFIYIATADLIPEIHKETNKKNIIIQSMALISGVAVIFILTNIFGHAH